MNCGHAWIIGAAACAAIALSAPAAAAPTGIADGESMMTRLVSVLGTGDQAAYERYARENYAAGALAEYPAEMQASFLARIYTDTGGFKLERVVGQGPDWVQAEARAKITGLRYCLTLNRSTADGRQFVTDFSAKDLHPGGPELKPPGAAEVRARVDALIEDYAARGLFSGVVLIAKDGKVIFRKAYGKASLIHDRPMTLDTRLNTASIGKVFTGVAIAQLVEAGRLSYDDTVGKVWPDYPDQDVRDNVTIRQLLTHTSGLGPKDYYDHPRYPELGPRLGSLSDYMQLVAGTPRGGEPGKYVYSNSGYIILGAIIERLSGQSFYDYLRDHVFRPAGMTHTLYASGEALKRMNVASSLTYFHEKPDHSHIYQLGRLRETGDDQSGIGGPQGGAWVTADDLLAFETALRDGKLIKPATFREMITPQGPSGAGASGLTGDARLGLGIEVIRRNGHTFYGHTGGDFGVASFFYWYPDLGYTTIALTNRDPRAPRVLLNLIRGMLTRQTVGGATPPASGCTPPPAPS